MIAAKLLMAALPLAQPAVIGAEMVPLSRSAELARDLTRVAGPAWVGYQVAAAPGAHESCAGVVDLDRDGTHTSGYDALAATALYVFVRSDDGLVREVRSATGGCRVRVDQGPIYWLSPVSSRESLEFLGGLAGGGAAADVSEHALQAIAWHAGYAADDRLDAFATGAFPDQIRGQAIFWMGAARGSRGLESLRELSGTLLEPALRKKLVFALHLSDADGATPLLIEHAREDADREIRERALFWLAQEAGERAAGAIVDAVTHDPDVDVKKKAVFALAQLPAEEGVPLLVEVAETHRDPEVRKKAFFWLGQTADPRALALFERVLTR